MIKNIFKDGLIFERYDFFIQRFKVLNEFCGTAHQIFKLQKVEIGGLRGKILSDEVRKINEKFKSIYSVFGTKTYDCLDEKDVRFLIDHNKFMSEVWKLDRKIGQVLSRAFDDCNVSSSILKLLRISDDLSLRGLIALELSDKMPLLVIMLNAEMDESKKTFEKYKEKININGKPVGEKNMPVLSSKLKFVNLLKTKIMTTIKFFKNLEHPICYSPGGDLLLKKYKALQLELNDYEQLIFSEWAEKAEKITFEGLALPLIKRNKESSTLKVNFDKDTMEVLVDVRYLKKEFQTHDIPKPLQKIFQQFEYFKAVHNILDQVVENYNYIKTTTNKVEYKLVEDEINEIDLLLRSAETTLNWLSPNLLSYVRNIQEIIKDLNDRISKSQDNMILIYREMSQWETIPMYTRLDDENKKHFDLELKESIKLKRYEEIKVYADKIHVRISENLSLFDIDLDETNPSTNWKNYLSYVDGIVRDSVLNTVSASLAFLLDETDLQKNPSTLFSVKMELFDPDIIFRPSLDKDITNNFFDIMIGLIDDIFQMARLVPRITEKSENFYEVICKHKELKKLKKILIGRIDSVMNKATEIKQKNSFYSFLWMDNKTIHLEYFLKYSRQPNLIEIEKLAGNPDALKLCKPKLADFKKEIDYFEDIHNEIKSIAKEQRLDSWFNVDLTPLKSTLQMCAKRWSYLFKKHLLDKVVNSLTNFEDFLENAEIGLQTQISEGDYEGLVKMMGLIKEVKDKQPKYDKIFEEMRNILLLLQNYNVDIPEKTLQQLNLLPEKWLGVLQLASTGKHLIISLQNVEVGKLTNKMEDYEKQQRHVRNDFTQSKLFQFSCENSYILLKSTFGALGKINNEITSLKSECVLFDIQAPAFELVTRCLVDVR